MLLINNNNYSLNFGNVTKVQEKAVQNLEKALKIANKSPQTYNIYFSTVPEQGRVISILRHCSDTIRNAMYDIRTGKLIKIERLSYSKDYEKVYNKGRNLIEYDTRGNYKCGTVKCEDFKSFIDYCKLRMGLYEDC